MATKKLPRIHPGDVLREDFLVPMKFSPYAVARAISVPRTRIERLARGETPVTADTALRSQDILERPPRSGWACKRNMILNMPQMISAQTCAG